MRAKGVILILFLFLSSGCIESEDGKITIDVSSLQEKANDTDIGIPKIGGPSIKELRDTPELYVNETVTLKGTLLTYVHGPYSDLGVEYELEDDQGYKYMLASCSETGRRLETGLGAVYEVTGEIISIEVCICQENKTETQANGQGWRKLKEGTQYQPYSNCEKEQKSWLAWPPFGSEKNMNVTVTYRCKPESKITAYYLKCSEPMIKKF